MKDQDIIDLLNKEAKKCKSLECDGTTKVLSYILNKNNIKHSVCVGELLSFNDKEKIPFHYWIVLENGLYVDYKAQMWLNEKAPNGVFRIIDYPDYYYNLFTEILDNYIDDITYHVLTKVF